jgi:hypothetical protein
MKLLNPHHAALVKASTCQHGDSTTSSIRILPALGQSVCNAFATNLVFDSKRWYHDGQACGVDSLSEKHKNLHRLSIHLRIEIRKWGGGPNNYRMNSINLLTFPNRDQSLFDAHNRNWHILRSIRIYFGNKTGRRFGNFPNTQTFQIEKHFVGLTKQKPTECSTIMLQATLWSHYALLDTLLNLVGTSQQHRDILSMVGT